MIGWICFLLLFTGAVCAVITGNLPTVSQAILATPADCVSLLLKLGGSICFYCGLMRVAESSGLVARFSKFLAAPIRFLIPATCRNEGLSQSVTMNLASNFFGLGNGATPYGIRACEQMNQGAISRSLATFVILNTCSVQLIPTTVCALRQANGATDAMDILPAVWIVQISSCVFGILLTRLLFREEK